MFWRPETLFPAWILIACLWAYSPLQSFLEAIYLAPLVMVACYFPRIAAQFSQTAIEAASRGLLVGTLLAGAFVCFEIWMANALVRTILTHFPSLERGLEGIATAQDVKVLTLGGNIPTRSPATFALLWSPAILAATLYTDGLQRWLSYAGIAAATATIVLHPLSGSQTAQIILSAVIVVLSVGFLLPRLAYWMVAIAFLANAFLVVPASLAIFSAGMHRDPGIDASLRARFIIWNYTAERVVEHPIIGVGTASTRFIDDQRVRNHEVQQPPDHIIPAQTRAHPHNVYLQIWYELGAVGLVAFALLGLSLLGRVSGLRAPVYAFALSHFFVVAALIGPTYGLWQNWFQSVIVLSILAFTLVASGRFAHQTS